MRPQYPRSLAIVSLILASLLCACSSQEDAPPGPPPTLAPEEPAFEPRFAFGPCTMELPEGQEEGETATCGTLAVPENRGTPGDATIELAVAILRATGAAREPDPVIYLSGGPGGSALEFDMQQFTLDFAEPIQRTRDIVFFDQRGVGRSSPALDCPEVGDTFEAEIASEDAPSYVTAIVACRNRLRREGVDLDAYTSVENAADIADLAIALKYDRYNLLGVSYGTRLALTAMRDAPERIRSAVLDSAFPLQANLYADGAATLEESLQELFRACDSDPACRDFAPNLQQTFFDVAARLDAEPFTVEPSDEDTDSGIEIDGDSFVHLIFEALYVTSIIPSLPSLFVVLEEGDTEVLEFLSGGLEYVETGASVGMYLSVQCAEEVPFNTSTNFRPASDPAFARLTSAARGEIEAIRSSCGAWSVRRTAPSENEPVTSDVPTLVLSGQFDPVTPPSYARETIRTLENGYLFEFPGYGHAVLDYGCTLEIVSAFIIDPSVEPGRGCLHEIEPIVFEEP